MAFIGLAAKLELKPGAGAYTTITETAMIQLPAGETSTVETTHLASGLHRTYTPGLTDMGTLGFECFYSMATYSTLNGVRGKLKDGSVIPPSGADILWRITSPDENGAAASGSQIFEFNGILTKLEVEFATNDVTKIKGEVKVSGAVTVTASA